MFEVSFVTAVRGASCDRHEYARVCSYITANKVAAAYNKAVCVWTSGHHSTKRNVLNAQEALSRPADPSMQNPGRNQKLIPIVIEALRISTLRSQLNCMHMSSAEISAFDCTFVGLLLALVSWSETVCCAAHCYRLAD